MALVPDIAIENFHQLSPAEIKLFCFYCRCRNKNTGGWKLSDEQAATGTHLSRNRVSEARNGLEKKGWIIKEQNSFIKVIYGFDSVENSTKKVEFSTEFVENSTKSDSHIRNIPAPLPASVSDETGEAPKPLSAADEISVGRIIWTEGVELLTQGETNERTARSFLGKLAKTYSNELLAECIAVTQANNPVEPKEFLIGTLKSRSGNQKPSVGNYRKNDGDLLSPNYEMPKSKLTFDQVIEFSYGIGTTEANLENYERTKADYLNAAKDKEAAAKEILIYEGTDDFRQIFSETGQRVAGGNFKPIWGEIHAQAPNTLPVPQRQNSVG